MPIDNKFIWIIGASSGIGAALAVELAKKQVNLCLSARSTAGLEEVRTGLAKDTPVLILPCDVSEYQELQQAWQTLKTHWPRVDTIIFMAGVYSPSELTNISKENIDASIDINLKSAFYLVNLVLADLLNQDTKIKPQLIFCASVAGYRGLPRAQPYAATKAGLISLVESLRAEVGHSLDIKLINPGFVATRLTAKNHFYMPAIISREQAAKEICSALASETFELHFPKRFTYLMKVIRWLPDTWYFRWFSSKHRLQNQTRENDK